MYVKDGIITWEAQETDYPTVGPDRPEYEPRGCPRGAAFSWYTYSPTRVSTLRSRSPAGDVPRSEGNPQRSRGRLPSIVSDPAKRARYVNARGRVVWCALTWAEALELMAAAHVQHHQVLRSRP